GKLHRKVAPRRQGEVCDFSQVVTRCRVVGPYHSDMFVGGGEFALQLAQMFGNPCLPRIRPLSRMDPDDELKMRARFYMGDQRSQPLYLVRERLPLAEQIQI